VQSLREEKRNITVDGGYHVLLLHRGERKLPSGEFKVRTATGKGEEKRYNAGSFILTRREERGKKAFYSLASSLNARL